MSATPSLFGDPSIVSRAKTVVQKPVLGDDSDQDRTMRSRGLVLERSRPW